MVQFNTSYFNTLDKPRPKEASIGEFGTSAKMGDILDALKGEINVGAKHVELGFTGKEKGSLSQMNTTPEMFDKLKREEVRQLAKINGVTLSTHATLAISGVSGITEQGFSDKARTGNLMELKRTIDFAADTARGGAIVVHTNEFQREVKDKQFIMGSKKDETIFIADKESGKLYGFKKEDKLSIPKWKTDKKGNYVDIDGKPIDKFNDYSKRVLEQNKNEKQDWDEIDYEGFKNKVKEWNTAHPKEKPLVPEKEFFFLQHLQKIQAESPRGMQYLQSASEAQKQYLKMTEDAKAFKELEKGKKYDDKFLLKMLSNEYSEGIIQKYKDEKWAPSKILEKEAERIKGEASFYMEGYIGFERQKMEIEKIYERADTIENVGVQRSAETLAEAAIYAYQIEKLKNIDKPMFIAPENMMAEWGYGSHPEELKNIIIKSREQMVKYLTEPKIEDPNGKKDDKGKLIMIQNPYYRKLDRKQAEKIAKDHIKATFDIGHANTWAKYFNAENPNLSEDERKKKFDVWLLDQVKDLSKAGVLGHIHLSDNFGYYDEHLSPGMGNAPMEKFMEIIRKDPNYEGKVIVEWGSQPSVEQRSEAMLGAWAKLASSPIYRIEGRGPKWTDIENSGYFGRMSSPANIVGNYGSSMGKDWALWSYSEAPIE